MKGNMKRCAVLLLALGVIVSAAVGCGGGNAAADAVAPSVSTPTMEKSEAMDGNYLVMSDTATGNGGSSNPIYRDPNAKLIREANLNIQTTEFEQASVNLEALVIQMGGYFQNVSFRGGNYQNVNANRTGDYTIRIPAEQYDSFMGQAGTLGYVISRNETTQNIGEQYYDTEARLKTQKTKQERLLSLLEKAENMEDIISLETALSDVEYEIERLSSTLNRYDSLVGFSTVYLILNEVHKVSEESGVTNTLGQRMSMGFSSSVDGLIDGTQNLLVWISYNVFGLMILAAAALCGGMAVHKVRSRKKTAITEEPKNQMK